MRSGMFQGLDEAELAASLTRGNITYFPVVPGRVEFAVEVRQWILENRPEVLAIELPAPLRSAYLRAIARFPELSVIRFPDPVDPLQWVYIPIEPTDPFIEALRTAHELDIRVEFIEPNWGDRPHIGDAYPDTYAIQLIGRERYIDSFRLQNGSDPLDELSDYAAAMARKLQGVQPDREVVAVISLNMLDLVLEAMEIPQERAVEPRGSAYLAELCNAHPECLAEITVEFPFLIERYNQYRADLAADPRSLDRMTTQLAILETAEVGFWRSSGDRLEAWQYRQIAKFARNLSHSSGELAADVVDLTLAARGVVSDEYAARVWEAMNQYPAQRDSCELPTLKIASEEIWCRKRRIRLHQRASILAKVSERPAMVVIFDEDREDLRYPLKVSGAESASYSNTESDWGGLLINSAEPLGDIWSGVRFDAAETKGERLLLAALHHGGGRRVTLIAAKPPRRLMREIAGFLDRQIEYVPIGQVPRSTLEAIRRSAARPDRVPI